MKRILSIDGGGIRGLIPALVLAELEKGAGKPVAEMFDLLAGTSTGGILALGLSKRNAQGRSQFTASDLAELYRKRGRDIFSRSFWKGMASLGNMSDEKYSHEGLEAVLLEYFGDATLGEALCHVLITSYDIHKREPVFFKSWRDEWRGVKMRHAARATSAAPTYFEPALVPVGTETRALVDGGVFINNPAVSAYAEAKRIFPEEQDFFIVSIGTGELTRKIPYEDAKDWGKAGWMLPVLSCMFDGVSDAVGYQLNQLLGERFVRMQTQLTIASDDMDNASSGNLENLTAEAKKLLREDEGKLGRILQSLG